MPDRCSKWRVPLQWFCGNQLTKTMQTADTSVAEQLALLAPYVPFAKIVVKGVTKDGRKFAGELGSLELGKITIISDDPDLVINVLNILILEHDYVNPGTVAT